MNTKDIEIFSALWDRKNIDFGHLLKVETGNLRYNIMRAKRWQLGLMGYGRWITSQQNNWALGDSLTVLNYTMYMRMHWSALKIQKQWGMYKQKKAYTIICDAFLEWKHKKTKRWNPYTFEGVALLCLEYVRMKREQQNYSDII
jgi:hypothetical protein